VGAGAVGGTVAARLQRAGADVFVIDTDPEHVRAISLGGLLITGVDERGEMTPMEAGTPDEATGSPDVVLLAVRSQATLQALTSIGRERLTPTTDVVSLQNGLNEDHIAELIGPDRTIGCVVGFGATWIKPGHIELNAKGDLTIGRLDGSSDARLEAVRDLLSLAFPTSITDNIRGALWAKMLVNSMTVLGALGGMLTGDVLVNRERRRIVADIVAEGVRVAKSEGVRLPNVFGMVPPEAVDGDQWHAIMDRVLIRVGEAFGAIKSVTWRDFELGRKTEIDAVTGEIVRRGERGGVPTPLSSAVYRALKEIEAGSRTPAASNLDSLVTVAR
jgi:2-dehydropantoate 2-reductase